VSLGGSLPVPPLVFGFGQIDPTQQQRKLFVTQDDLALRIPGLRPGETPFLQPLGTDPESASVPDEDLQPIALAVAEQEQVPAQRLTRQSIPNQTVQPLEPFAHVGDPGCQIDPCGWTQSKHGLRPLQDAQQAFERTRIEIRMHLDPVPAQQHHGEPTTRFVLLRRFRGRQLHRHQPTGRRRCGALFLPALLLQMPIQRTEAQPPTAAKLAPPPTAVYKLGHQLLNFRTGTSLGRWQLCSCGHPDTSTQTPPVEQVCWSDAYARGDGFAQNRSRNKVCKWLNLRGHEIRECVARKQVFLGQSCGRPLEGTMWQDSMLRTRR